MIERKYNGPFDLGLGTRTPVLSASPSFRFLICTTLTSASRSINAGGCVQGSAHGGCNCHIAH